MICNLSFLDQDFVVVYPSQDFKSDQKCNSHKLLKYYKYPFTTDLTLGDASNISTSFPVVTVCLNSMHSRLKILENYNNSEVNKRKSQFVSITSKIQLLIKSLGFLYGFYADTHDATMRDIVRTLKSTGSLIQHRQYRFSTALSGSSLAIECLHSSDVWNQWKDKYDINEFFRTTSQPINVSACRLVKHNKPNCFDEFETAAIMLMT